MHNETKLLLVAIVGLIAMPMIGCNSAQEAADAGQDSIEAGMETADRAEDAAGEASSRVEENNALLEGD